MIKLVISDLHISAGTPTGEYSPYEDFHYDDALAEFLDFYSSGEYRNIPVELILNGDILDPLKVSVGNTFPDRITNAIALEKVGLCLNGHPTIVRCWRKFLSQSNKSITYIMGNHDLEVAYLSVQDLLRSIIAGPSNQDRIRFRIFDPFYDLPGGVRVCHGNQFEALNRVDYHRLFITRGGQDPCLNLPWGSIFLLKVLLPIKEQRPYITQIHPFSRYFALAMLSDTSVALPAGMRASYYFFKTRFWEARQRSASLKQTFSILQEEAVVAPELADVAFSMMAADPRLTAVVMGHSHAAKIRHFGQRDAIYVNTGTWTKLISLDLSDLGVHTRFTYSLIDYRDTSAVPKVRLFRWFGNQKPYSELRY